MAVMEDKQRLDNGRRLKIEIGICRKLNRNSSNSSQIFHNELELKCSTSRCVEILTMCYTFSDSRHFLVDVSIFPSCISKISILLTNT
jgi:hypothetical protein